MSRSNLPVLFPAVAILSLTLHAVGNGPLIDNLSEPLRARTLIFATASEGLWAAQSFHADGNRYRVDSIETILGAAAGEPIVVAELRDGPEPTGALLTTFTLLPLPIAAHEVTTLTPDFDVIIEAGGAATLILGVANQAEYEWSYADSNLWIGPGTFGNYHYSPDAGQTWANFGSDFPYYLRVNVTLICQPDCNADGTLNLADFGCFQTRFATQHPYADCNGDAVLNLADFGCFQTLFAIGCP